MSEAIDTSRNLRGLWCKRMERKATIRAHYEHRLDTYDEGHLVLDWENSKSQSLRFQVLLDGVDLNGKSLLDAGCGVGDLLAYCRAQGIDLRYTGIDMLGKMVEEAKRRQPDGRFRRVDLLEKVPFRPGEFDVVFCSGIFNLNVEDSCASARRILTKVIPLASDSVVFNMLSSKSPDKESAYCYFDPAEVVEWPEIRNMSTRVVTGYLPNDFSVICTVG